MSTVVQNPTTLDEVSPEDLANFLAHYPLQDSPDVPAAQIVPERPRREPCRIVPVPEAPPPVPDISYAAHKANFDQMVADHITSPDFPHASADAALLESKMRAYSDTPDFQKQLKAYLDNYADLGCDDAEGDVYGYLTDLLHDDIDDVRDRRLNYALHVDLDDLAQALRHTTDLPLTIRFPEAKNKKAAVHINWKTPLYGKRRILLSTLVEWLLAEGALALHAEDNEARRLWAKAYTLAYRTVGGPSTPDDLIRKGFPEETVNDLVETIAEAHETQFANGAFASTAVEYWGDEP